MAREFSHDDAGQSLGVELDPLTCRETAADSCHSWGIGHRALTGSQARNAATDAHLRGQTGEPLSGPFGRLRQKVKGRPSGAPAGDRAGLETFVHPTSSG